MACCKQGSFFVFFRIINKHGHGNSKSYIIKILYPSSKRPLENQTELHVFNVTLFSVLKIKLVVLLLWYRNILLIPEHVGLRKIKISSPLGEQKCPTPGPTKTTKSTPHALPPSLSLGFVIHIFVTLIRITKDIQWQQDLSKLVRVFFTISYVFPSTGIAWVRACNVRGYKGWTRVKV